MIVQILQFFIGGFLAALRAALLVAPIWVPIGLTIVLWRLWMTHIQTLFISKTKMMTLEVRLPKEILKTPKSMEYALSAFAQTSPSDWYAAYWEGKVRAVSSFEIVSDGGKIKFYIHARAVLRDLIEASMYAQYPEIELHEVPDYTRDVAYGVPGSKWDLMGMEYKLAKDDAYPIRTYVDLGLDREGVKDIEKSDPMTSILEFAGQMQPGEKFWLQFVIMASNHYPAPWWAKDRKPFDKQGEELVKQLSKRSLVDEVKKKGGDPSKIPLIEYSLTSAEQDVLRSVERNLAKVPFDVGIRSIYLGPKDNFRGFLTPGLIGLFRPFTSSNLNSLKQTRVTSVDFPWQDPFNIQVPKKKQHLFEAYCRRGFFFPPFDRKPFILSAEELATLFHLPGSVAETPTLGRIDAKRGEAPGNLPI